MIFGKTESEKQQEKEDEERKQREYFNKKFLIRAFNDLVEQQADIDELLTKGYEPISITSDRYYTCTLYKKLTV